METEINFFTETMTAEAMFNGMQTDVYMHPEPDDEDDEEKDDNKSDATPNDEDPPLDDKVVHSPVPTQPGGRPKP